MNNMEMSDFLGLLPKLETIFNANRIDIVIQLTESGLISNADGILILSITSRLSNYEARKDILDSGPRSE